MITKFNKGGSPLSPLEITPALSTLKPIHARSVRTKKYLRIDDVLLEDLEPEDPFANLLLQQADYTLSEFWCLL